MKKQLIVVVHGVGVRDAGISTDLLATALDDDPPLARGGTPSGPSVQPGQATPWRPHSSDDFHLRELPKYSTNGKRSVFPARIRRYRRYDLKDPAKVVNERVVADFYWGDISATGKEVLSLIVGFFKIVLGLSHAVRENARSVFDGTGRFDGFFRWLASAAALTIHGPIFAINIVLMLGLWVGWAVRRTLVRLGDAAAQKAYDDGNIQALRSTGALEGETLIIGCAMIALCLGIAYWLVQSANSYLIKFLGRWLAAVAVILALCVALERGVEATNRDAGATDQNAQTGIFSAIDVRLKDLNCEWVPESQLVGKTEYDGADVRTKCMADYTGHVLYGMRLQGMMVALWGFVMVAAIVLGIASALRQKPVPGSGPVSFVMPALGLMMLLWFLVFAALWSTVLNLPFNWQMNPNHINSALRGVGPAVVALVVLVVIAWRLHKRKLRELGRLPEPSAYFDDAPRLAERHRLLIGKRLLWTLNVFIAAVLLLSIDGILRGFGWGHILPFNIPEFLQRHAGWFMSGLALLAGFILGAARNAFALGIAIFTDVLVYLNDYSWNTAATDDERNGTASPSWVRRMFGQKAARTPDPDTPHGYWPRQRIQDRLKVLMAQLIEDEAPDQIVIVSHSQGTVIAIDVIDAEARNWIQPTPRGVTLELVTMGSPYTHLYTTYFPSSFRPHRLRDNLWPMSPSAASGGGVLNDWNNIFRVDDFVGTYIDGSGLPAGGAWPDRQWPREHAVPKNGHTMYWTDENVAEILRPLLAAS